MAGEVRVERQGRIGWVVFDHQARRNAIDFAMWQRIPEVAQELAADDRVRVVILRGAGETAFVAGADISEFAENRTGDNVADYDRENYRAFGALAALDKPVIAMVHGFCVGGGVAIALSADLRYSADDGQFAIPAARLGLGYHWAGIDTLAQLVGLSSAKEIFFTARRFSAAEALAMGLVNAVHAKADLEERVVETAERIAANAPLTLRAAKLAAAQLARPSAQRDFGPVDRAIADCYHSEDYREGVQAFLEKRKPMFKGR